MILGVSTTLCFSWLYYIISLFEVWIGFRSKFFVVISSTVSLLICGLLLISVVSLSAITILGIQTNRKESDSFGLLSTATSSCG